MSAARQSSAGGAPRRRPEARGRGAGRHTWLPVLVAGLLLGACDGNPFGSDHAEEVVGFSLVSGFRTVAQYRQGQTPDSIRLAADTVLDVGIVWKDANADPADLGDEYTWSILSEDPSVLRFVPDPSPNPWDGGLRAGDPGLTTVRVRLLHEGHEDFAGVLPVRIH